jgi:hypothetical protein
VNSGSVEICMRRRGSHAALVMAWLLLADPTLATEPVEHRRLGSGRWKEAKTNAKAATAASKAPAFEPTSPTRRITRGLGVFSGADFPCDKDRDAFVGAPWARNACLLKCSPDSTSTRPRCANAIAVCERLSQCATIDINVEGSVATLKSETPLSARTSHVKQISVTKSRGDRAIGQDGACTVAAKESISLLRMRALGNKPACIFDCPALNCTRGIEVCYLSPTCVGADLSFNVEGRAAVARLRYAAPDAAASSRSVPPAPSR